MNDLTNIENPCPQCGGPMTRGLDESTCTKCGFRILVERTAQEAFIVTEIGNYPKRYELIHSCPNCGHHMHMEINFKN